MPMTKTQVVAYLAEEVGVTKKQAAAALDALAGLAAKIIKKGEKLALPGFVTVKVQNRKARIGRNPQTGEALKIPGQSRKSRSGRGFESDPCPQEKNSFLPFPSPPLRGRGISRILLNFSDLP